MFFVQDYGRSVKSSISYINHPIKSERPMVRFFLITISMKNLSRVRWGIQIFSVQNSITTETERILTRKLRSPAAFQTSVQSSQIIVKSSQLKSSEILKYQEKLGMTSDSIPVIRLQKKHQLYELMLFIFNLCGKSDRYKH